jgi:hypothetical protein
MLFFEGLTGCTEVLQRCIGDCFSEFEFALVEVDEDGISGLWGICFDAFDTVAGELENTIVHCVFSDFNHFGYINLDELLAAQGDTDNDGWGGCNFDEAEGAACFSEVGDFVGEERFFLGEFVELGGVGEGEPPLDLKVFWEGFDGGIHDCLHALKNTELYQRFVVSLSFHFGRGFFLLFVVVIGDDC